MTSTNPAKRASDGGHGDARKKVAPGVRPRNRKSQIVDAARELFVVRGYPDVSMGLIAESVGITAGALYRHFDNKVVLLDRVLKDRFSFLDNPIVAGHIDAAIDEVISHIVDHPDISDLWLHELHYLDAERKRGYRQRMLAYGHSLIPALRDAHPNLSPEQEEFLIWSVMSVASSAGRRSIRVPVQARLSTVRGAVRAIADAQQLPIRGLRSVEVGSLQPVTMRERLLIAASKQFGANGYHETSMASIGAAAEVTGPNLYSYFASKADLLRAVYDRGMSALWLTLSDAMTQTTDPSHALTKAVRSYVGLLGLWAATLEAPGVGGVLSEAQRASRWEYVGELVTLLMRAIPELTTTQARLRVQIGLLMVSDLSRNRRVACFEGLEPNLVAVVLAVLFHPSTRRV